MGYGERVHVVRYVLKVACGLLNSRVTERSGELATGSDRELL